MTKPIRRGRSRRLSGVEFSRIIGHIAALVWPIMFLLVTPQAFSIISDAIIHIWMPVAALAAVGAIIGVVTRYDLKVELPSLYLLLIGPVIYFFAQLGLILVGIEDAFQNRFALLFFVLWHISLLLPRLVELEGVRRREQLKAKSRQ